MSTESTSRDHLHAAGEHLREAVERVTDRVVDPQLRGNLHGAARSLLSAGIAALDEAERRAESRRSAAKPS